MYVGSGCEWWIATVIWRQRLLQEIRYLEVARCQAWKTKIGLQFSPMKVMLMLFFVSKGMLYQNFAVPNSTVNSATYQSLLHNLWYHIGWKRLYLYDIWLLHHDKMMPHVSTATTQFSEEESVTIFPHLLCSLTMRLWISRYFCSWKRSCVGTASTRIDRLNRLFTPHYSTFWQTNSGKRSSWNGVRECRNVLPLAAVTLKRANKVAWRVTAMKICNSFCTFLPNYVVE